jgi:hypothetical protein
MKKITFSLLAAVSIIVYACNDGHSTHNEKEAAKTEQPAAEEKPVKQVKASFTNVDAGVAAYMKQLTGDYLAIKNALTNGKAGEAADASKNMETAIKGFDKSLLTAEQKKVYDANEDDLKEHAEHMAKNAGDIEHQREHFSMMSEDMYALVKAFGGGKTLYHDHCPMAKENKGAMWLSESKAIRNPYFGDKMIECGSVEEEIQ